MSYFKSKKVVKNSTAKQSILSYSESRVVFPLTNYLKYYGTYSVFSFNLISNYYLLTYWNLPDGESINFNCLKEIVAYVHIYKNPAYKITLCLIYIYIYIYILYIYIYIYIYKCIHVSTHVHTHTHNIYMHSKSSKMHSKSSKPHPEWYIQKVLSLTQNDAFKKFLASPRMKIIAEHFCCGHTLLFLIKLEKLIQIFLVL